jgi:hypothetical protein
MSFTPITDEARAAAIVAATDSRARRANGDATVTSDEAAAAAALYVAAKAAGWNVLDCVLSLVTERTAVGERFRAV